MNIKGKWVIVKVGSNHYLVEVIKETPKKFTFYTAPQEYSISKGVTVEPWTMMKNVIIAIADEPSELDWIIDGLNMYDKMVLDAHLGKRDVLSSIPNDLRFKND